MMPKFLCKYNRHRWGDELYWVRAWTAPNFDGEVALVFCRDCNAVKYDHVSMSRPL